MKLYHYTNKKINKLVPQLGGSRHDGEDDFAKGKPVIYLTDSPRDIFSDDSGVYKYKYTVDIEDKNPNLFLDNKHKRLTNDLIDFLKIKEETSTGIFI